MLLATQCTSQVALVVKNLPASAGDIRDAGLISGLGRSPEGRHGDPLQYSRLGHGNLLQHSRPGNPMDRGAWWAMVHGVIQSWTRLK